MNVTIFYGLMFCMNGAKDNLHSNWMPTFHDVQVLKTSNGSFWNDAKKTSHHRQGHLQNGFNECTSHPVENCFAHWLWNWF
jgi:hypothetical protein